jgi:hypothetical protein
VLPFPHSMLYPLALGSPHWDKLATKRIVSHVSDSAWFDAADASATDKLVPDNWAVRAGPVGSSTNVVIVRPAFLTDGDATGVYRANPLGAGLKAISQKDVAHFSVEDVL